MGGSSTCVGDRKGLQWFLACLVVRALPRVFSGTGEQHSHLDELLLHRAVPSSLGTRRAPRVVARCANWVACCHFSGFLHSSGKRQKDAQGGWSIASASRR